MPKVWKIPDPPPIKADTDQPNNSGRICRTCGYRIGDHTRKLFGQWVCNLALLDNGHWIHASRIYEAELMGRKVIGRLIEDV